MKRLSIVVQPAKAPKVWPIWELWLEGFLLATYFTQNKAIERAARLGNTLWEETKKPSELQIKGRDGKIRDSRSYGADPKRTKG